MATVNANWYASNATRKYPLADAATAVGDDGTLLPPDVLVGLSLRWPEELGGYALLSAVTITPTLVTLLVSAVPSPVAINGEDFVPLAALTLRKPVQRHRLYHLQPLADGVGGFAAFGDVSEAVAVRMSLPSQGLLDVAECRPYRRLPVEGIGKEHRVDVLTGVVSLIAGPGVVVRQETVTFEDEERAAIVVRLAASVGEQSPLQLLSGPCGGRPESRSCLKEGVETVNGVRPDCNGNINIAYWSLTQSPYESCGSRELGTAGVTLDQPLGIEDVCIDTTPGRYQGQDYCDSESSLSASSDSSLSAQPLLAMAPPAEPCNELPYVDWLCSPLAASWVVRRGQALLVPGDAPTVNGLPPHTEARPFIRLADPTRRTLLLWEDCAYSSCRNVSLETLVRLQPGGGRVNGGLVWDYRQSDEGQLRAEYYQLQLDAMQGELVLLFFNGSRFVRVHGVTLPQPPQTGQWYHLSLTVTGAATQVVAAAAIRAYGSVETTASFNVTLTRHGGDGVCGLGTHLSVADFGYWRMDYA